MTGVEATVVPLLDASVDVAVKRTRGKQVPFTIIITMIQRIPRTKRMDNIKRNEVINSSTMVVTLDVALTIKGLVAVTDYKGR